MNLADEQYFNLLKLVLREGKLKGNRTGIKTIGIFGAQARFNLQNGFPLLTTKKVFFKGIVHELLWFLSGSTNIKYLVDNDVHIWDEWAYQKFKKQNPNHEYIQNQQQFINHIIGSYEFSEKWGELGEGTYGGMWRKFPYHLAESGGDNPNWTGTDYKFKVDQIQKVIDTLKKDPDSRRIVVSAWHPYWQENCVLAPCHCLFQFHTEELTNDERINSACDRGIIASTDPDFFTDKQLDELGIPRYKLNCQLYQRSCDLFLGVPFNIASYSLLTHLIAHVVNMEVGTFVWTGGDVHIYENHLNQVNEQLKRFPFPCLPKIVLNPIVDNIFKFSFKDIKIENYQCHPAIKAEVAV